MGMGACTRSRTQRLWWLLLGLTLVCGGCSGGERDGADRQARPARSEGTMVGTSELQDRAAHTATGLADGSALVAGGCVVDGCARATDSAVLLQDDGDVGVAKMTEARDAHTATLLDSGSVLVAGGFSGEGQPPLTGTEVFDPSTRTWSSAAPMRVGRGGHAAALLGDGRVLQIGGWVGPGQYTATSEIYDPTSRRFDPGPSLGAAVDGLSAVSLADGSVLVTGGQVHPGVASATADVISPQGVLTSVGPLAQARFKHTMVAMPTGEVLVIGGTSNDEDLLSSTEVYDPATQSFTAGPTMNSGRYKLNGSATLLPDGRVVVAGGGPGVEVIDVKAGTSTAVPNVGPSRASFSTASVVGPNVRVIGGYDRSIQLTRTNLTIPLVSLNP